MRDSLGRGFRVLEQIIELKDFLPSFIVFFFEFGVQLPTDRWSNFGGQVRIVILRRGKSTYSDHQQEDPTSAVLGLRASQGILHRGSNG